MSTGNHSLTRAMAHTTSFNAVYSKADRIRRRKAVAARVGIELAITVTAGAVLFVLCIYAWASGWQVPVTSPVDTTVIAGLLRLFAYLVAWRWRR